MTTARSIRLSRLALLCATLLGFCTFAVATRADDTDEDGYNIGETATTQTASGSPEQGPVRLARFSYLEGSVTWRPDESSDWSEGSVNLPLRQGAQIWVNSGGRAELQFDDGSLLRLGNSAVATLQTLYSDSDGEFTEIKLTGGVSSLRLKSDHSIFQVDTPIVSVKATGPAKIRIGVDDGVEVGVRQGTATVDGPAGSVKLNRGDYLELADTRSDYRVRTLPRSDSWEEWCDERDNLLASAEDDCRRNRIPQNIALVSGDLDSYGDWQQETSYGWVWYPKVAVSNWRPYYNGHWTWVNPFGWTWVSTEPWGWAPYHYGTWTHLAHGWGWVPGPATQCWSPAVVHFSEFNNKIAWCPLAPSEVRYNAAAIYAYRTGQWVNRFSIGFAGVYYPASASVCEVRPFNSASVNHTTFNTGPWVQNSADATGRFKNSTEYFVANNNSYGRVPFVPLNSKAAAGATWVAAKDFGGQGRYEPASPTEALFDSGRTVSAPAAGLAPVAGPADIRPTAQSIMPFRVAVPPPTGIAVLTSRAVYRAPIDPVIARTSGAIRTTPTSPSWTRGREPVTGTSAQSSAAVSSAVRVPYPGIAGPGVRQANPAPNATADRARQARQSLDPSDNVGRNSAPQSGPLARSGSNDSGRVQTPSSSKSGTSGSSATPSSGRASSPAQAPAPFQPRSSDPPRQPAPAAPAPQRAPDPPRQSPAPAPAPQRAPEPRPSPPPQPAPRAPEPPRQAPPPPPQRAPEPPRSSGNDNSGQKGGSSPSTNSGKH